MRKVEIFYRPRSKRKLLLLLPMLFLSGMPTSPPPSPIYSKSVKLWGSLWIPPPLWDHPKSGPKKKWSYPLSVIEILSLYYHYFQSCGHMVDFLQMLVDGSRARIEGIREGASLGQQERYFYSKIGDKGSLLCSVSKVNRLFKGFHNIWDQKTNQKKKSLQNMKKWKGKIINV